MPLRKLSRLCQLERVARWLARKPKEMRVRLARELVSSCRSLNRTIAELDRERSRTPPRLRVDWFAMSSWYDAWADRYGDWSTSFTARDADVPSTSGLPVRLTGH